MPVVVSGAKNPAWQAVRKLLLRNRTDPVILNNHFLLRCTQNVYNYMIESLLQPTEEGKIREMY